MCLLQQAVRASSTVQPVLKRLPPCLPQACSRHLQMIHQQKKPGRYMRQHPVAWHIICFSKGEQAPWNADGSRPYRSSPMPIEPCSICPSACILATKCIQHAHPKLPTLAELRHRRLPRPLRHHQARQKSQVRLRSPRHPPQHPDFDQPGPGCPAD